MSTINLRFTPDFSRFRCNKCNKVIKCDRYIGKQEVIKHCKMQGHEDKANSLQSQSRLTFSNPMASDKVFKKTEAEVRMAVLTASCYVPLAFHDQLLPTIGSIFPNSKIGAKYHSASTKAMCMLNLAIAPALILSFR